jgi:hypothetical protein
MKFFRLISCIIIVCGTKQIFSQGTWTQKALFPNSGKEDAVGFSILGKGYAGTGTYTYGSLKEFFEYDPTTNIWKQKADFAGTYRYGAVGFSIGTKGYIGTGHDNNSTKKDFWEWDQTTNVWTQKANFGGAARYYAVGFSIGTQGYIGTGFENLTNSAFKDFWEWDQATNVWTKKTDFGGVARAQAVAFSIGTKGYVGTGTTNIWSGSGMKDFWEWDQVANTWIQKADLVVGKYSATSFSIGTKGYVGTQGKDFWEYDPSIDTWTQKVDFGGVSRFRATGFSIGAKGYIGLGTTGATTYLCDLWEFDPNGNGILENEFENSISIFPNPTTTNLHLSISNWQSEKLQIEIFDVLGKEIFTSAINHQPSTIDISGFPSGVYYLKISSEEKSAVKKFVKM